ncbi:hypothetical protein [Pseudomonas agarici]
MSRESGAIHIMFLNNINQFGGRMGFVNEYVSQKTVKKYELAEQFIRRNPAYKSLPENFKPFWTIDRGLNIYIMGAGMANQAQEKECWISLLLNCNGKEFLVKLERGVESKKTQSRLI